MRQVSYQRGWGLLGWIIVLAVSSFFLTCLLKLGPVYMDYWTVRKVLQDVSAAGLDGRTAGELRTAIQRRLDTNRIEAFKASNIRFEETRDALIMDAGHERRVPLIGNIDVVVRFDPLRYSLER